MGDRKEYTTESYHWEECDYSELLAELFERKEDRPEIITEEHLAGLRYVLSSLKPVEQKILQLRYVDRKVPAEVADVLHISQKSTEEIEERAIGRLIRLKKWNYIRYGIAGYMRIRMGEIRSKEYAKGYCDGYRAGSNDGKSECSDTYNGNEVLYRPIETLHLSSRACNCLHRAGLKLVYDVVMLEENQLRYMRSLGTKTANEVAKAVRQHGFAHTAWDKYLLK